MKVAVIGAGISGLRTAMLLEKQGVEVEVFEARDRVGGRTWTIRDGAYDAGGEWIDSDHVRMIALIAELGLELAPSSGPRQVFYGGTMRTTDDLWPEMRQAEERFWQLADEGFQAGDTLADLIDASSDSEMGRWWMTANLRSDEGTDPDQVGLDGWLDFYKHYQDREGGELSAYRVKGGMGQVAVEMAKRVKGPIRLGLELISVSSGCLTFKRVKRGLLRASEVTFEGFDHVVISLPPLCVSRVDFDPPLPAPQKEAFETCGFAPIVKVAWVGREGRSAFYHSQMQQTWEGGWGRERVMIAYICGRDALAFSNGEEHLDGGTLHDWIKDPYAGGGFSFMRPGFMPLKPWLSKSHGNVCFVGEHTAGWMGFFEGAVESAERAVEEITDKMP